VNKLYIEFIVLLSILFIGTAYSMYLEKLRVNTYIYMGDPDLDIESYKVLIKCCSCSCCSNTCCKGIEDSQVNISIDNHTLIIKELEPCSHCHHPSIIWVGLILKNNGKLPLKINETIITSNPSVEINTTYYLYGPYKTGPLYPWGYINCSKLPYSGYNNSIIIDPDYKAIIWIELIIEPITNNILDLNITPQYIIWNYS